MNKVHQFLRNLDEGYKVKDLYGFMNKMEGPSFNSFLADLQGAIKKETGNTISTEQLKKSFSHLFILPK
jgi:hypothetical protein